MISNQKVIKPGVLFSEIKEDYKVKLVNLDSEFRDSIVSNAEMYEKVSSWKERFISQYDFNFDNYEEFKANTYIDGKFLEDLKYQYRNAKDDKKVLDFKKVIAYAETLTILDTYNKKKELYTKIINLTGKDFRHITKVYYFEVQRQMIVNGYAYKFQGHIGSVAINRCKNRAATHIVDTKATKENIIKLKKQGVELYDSEKEAYYKLHGLEYKGVDPRVFKINDYLYEFCLLWSGLKSSHCYKFEPVDTWKADLRGKTKEDFIREANGNLNYICNLEITFRTKVTICNEIDNTLYNKFIRNEHQTPITTRKTYR